MTAWTNWRHSLGRRSNWCSARPTSWPRADLVLTGGPSLFEAKRNRHPRVLCLPSSVDAKHLAQRMDLALIERLADADAGWHIVMVGPVVKIDPRTLPRRSNLHWLGQQPYELLPRLIEGWDVGLLPFALNASTRFISPTKTLEYMAAGKPAVSTAIQDVRTLYADVVRIADTHDEFLGACADILTQTASQQRRHTAAMATMVARSSWAGTAETIHKALELIIEPTTTPPTPLSPSLPVLAATAVAVGS